MPHLMTEKPKHLKRPICHEPWAKPQTIRGPLWRPKF